MPMRMQKGEERRLASRGRAADIDMYGSPRAKSVRMRPCTRGEPNATMLSRGREETVTMRSTSSLRATATGLSPLLAAATLCSGNAELTLSPRDKQVIEASPPILKMGMLELGQEYSVSFKFTNVGYRPTRFKIVCNGNVPGDLNFIRCINPHTGTAACGKMLSPGMTIKMEVQVKAGSLGNIDDLVEIHTPTIVFRIPVRAYVASTATYDIERTSKKVSIWTGDDYTPIARFKDQ